MLKSSSALRKLKNFFRIITLLYFIWIIFGTHFNQGYMLWNILLTWVPLEAASLINSLINKENKSNKYKILIILLGVLWLLFYPNSPYIITDFIHLAPNNYTIPNPKYFPYSSEPKYIFNDDIKIWYDFFNITIGVWIGCTVGMISLYMNHTIIEKKFNKFTGWIFTIVVSFLSGFAIYLGRFVRWNSWDVIFNPKNIFNIISRDINLKSIHYTLIFGILSFTVYFIFYLIMNLNSKQEP